jgi:hypothetical protein
MAEEEEEEASDIFEWGRKDILMLSIFHLKSKRGSSLSLSSLNHEAGRGGGRSVSEIFTTPSSNVIWAQDEEAEAVLALT